MTNHVRIVALFPELLGTYGDGGNVLILAQRARWRGIPTQVTAVHPGTPVPAGADLYAIGGGEDGAQAAAMAALRSGGQGASPLQQAVDGGAAILAVCAGLQLLGESFVDSEGVEMSGLGLLDVRTGRLSERAVGDVLATPSAELQLSALSGFENHGGHTVLGPEARPLARVRHGHGNGPDPSGRPASEGVLAPGIIATYLHGPVLARNPELADLLLAWAMGVPVAALPALEVPEHEALRRRVGGQD